MSTLTGMLKRAETGPKNWGRSSSGLMASPMVRNLRSFAGLSAIIFLLGSLGLTITLIAEGDPAGTRLPLLLLCSILAAAAVAVRWSVARGRYVQFIGAGFVMLGALAMAWVETGVVLRLGAPLVGLSGICLWLVLFPLLVPVRPRLAVLVAAVGAAALPFCWLIRWSLLGQSLGGEISLIPWFIPPVVCAAIAVMGARVVHGWNRALIQAQSELAEYGAWRLLSPLGRGGMGEVWQAEHRVMRRQAAVKRVSRQLAGEARESAERRFVAEAQAVANLRSPHTVQVYDFGIDAEGHPFMAMEFLQGITFAELAAAQGPLPPERCVHLIRQAAKSLAEAHRQGIIHRDIKPENMMCCSMGDEEDFCKVLDFGLARWLGQDSQLSAEGVVMGTPQCLPPEIAQGQEARFESDIYGLGCVWYHLITGSPLFPQSQAMALALAHVNEAPESPSRRLGKALPQDLEFLLLRCLAKMPQQRPANGAELLKELDELSLPPWKPLPPGLNGPRRGVASAVPSDVTTRHMASATEMGA
ncbi:MAG: serine/threonine protein kinase [Planctomycetota bacterium]|nr:MAG: serine/threonine protein kinase [Planctomycetota bacterium]